MSGPNSEYDPVQVTPLDEEHVSAMRADALAAIAAATDLDTLKQVRSDHAGDRSPLALANREIGALPPQARKDAGLQVSDRIEVTISGPAETLEAARTHEALITEETLATSVSYADGAEVAVEVATA